MGFYVTLRDGDGAVLRAIPDPLGGTFDAAGDFDELLNEAISPMLASLDPNADTTLSHSHMAVVAVETDALLARLPETAEAAGRAGPRWRGLTRFRAMVALCEADERLTLHFLGD